MKILFFKFAAIGAGATFGIAAMLCATYWYSTRPVQEKPWNESAFVVEGSPSYYQTDDGYIIFSYRLKNSTEHDLGEDSAYRYKLLVVRPDKSLTNPIQTDKGTASVETPIFIPAHQSGTLRLKVRASTTRAAGMSDEVFQKKLREYILTIMHGGEYFALFDETRHCRINLPAVTESSK